MKKIIKLTAIASVIIAPTLVQAQATSPMEVSAKVQAGCFFRADNINFGTLITPITNQSANANMYLHCSNGVNVTVDVVYGVAHLTSTLKTYIFQHYRTDNSSNDYWVYDLKGELLGYVYCHHLNTTVFTNHAKVEGFSCTKRNGNNVPTGWPSNSASGTYSLSFGAVSATMGKMTGISKGEQVIYSLEVPNDASKIWSQGFNTYNLRTTGGEQTVSMKANIASAGNPTHRMTPDSYQDTLTVVLTY